MLIGRGYEAKNDSRLRRQRAEEHQDASMWRILNHPEPRGPIALPAVGRGTPPVRILNPDGSLREVVPATEFRRRTRVAGGQKLKARGVVNPNSPWREDF